MPFRRVSARKTFFVSTFAWILVTGLAMSLVALSGSLSLLLNAQLVARLLPVAVAFATGALIGAAGFHMLPEAVALAGPGLAPYLWLVVGFVAFYLLEQVLHWHHTHGDPAGRAHIGYLVVLADGLHNLVDGIAVGASFTIDQRLGLGAWLAVALHEVPQEIGDFAVLRASGWSIGRALSANVVSALTFPIGGVGAYLAAGPLDLTPVLAFAAGSFIYIAAADLTPQLTAHIGWRSKLSDATALLLGLAALLAPALLE